MTIAIRDLGLVATIVGLYTVCAYADVPGNRGSASHEQVLRDSRDSQYQVVKGTDVLAIKTLDELRAGVEAWQSRIQSVAVDYRVTSIRLRESNSELEMKRQGNLGQAHWSRAYRYAMQGDKRLSIRTELLRKRLPDDRNRVGGSREMLLLWDGHRGKRYGSLDHSGTITATKPNNIEEAKRAYFRFIGFGYQSRTPDRFFTSTASRRVLPHLESVDGFPCHVISSGWETIWIDHQHGYAVRRRVLLSGISLSAVRLAQVRYCKDFSEADQGIWWPKECCAITYLAALDPSPYSSDIHDIWTVTVDKLRINDVPDETFAFGFPVGTFVADTTINTAYYMPHKADDLDEAISLGVPIKENGAVSSEPGVVLPKP